MSTPSVPQLAQDINTANVNTTGTVPWTGATGLKYIVQSLTSLAQERGFMVAQDLSGLALLGGSDTKLAVVEGKGIYKFNPSGFAPLPGSVQAFGGGVWELLFDMSAFNAPYYEQFGDGALTTIPIEHNLNSIYPDITVYNVLNTPYTIDTSYTVEIVDANNINLIYSTAPASVSRMVKIKSA